MDRVIALALIPHRYMFMPGVLSPPSGKPEEDEADAEAREATAAE